MGRSWQSSYGEGQRWRRAEETGRDNNVYVTLPEGLLFSLFFFLVLGHKDQLEAYFNKMLCTKWSLTHLEMLPTLTSPLKAEAVVAQQSTVMP